MTDSDVIEICDAIIELTENHTLWRNEYDYDPRTNEFTCRQFEDKTAAIVAGWFE